MGEVLVQAVDQAGKGNTKCGVVSRIEMERCERHHFLRWLGGVQPGTFVGHDALDKFAGDLRTTHPHFAYTPHGEPQALHNAGRLAWGSGPQGEAPDYTGLDVIIVRDGRIAALYVFLDSMPA